MRVFAMDEARFGLISLHKRRYCPKGIRPSWLVRRKYEWTWLYAAVEPASGEDFCLYLPRLDGDCYEIFLHHLSRCYPDDFIVLIRDNAPAHSKRDLNIPANIISLALPPYSPELNPAERWFLEFRRVLANRLFDSLDTLEAALTQVLESYRQNPAALKQLTLFPWWKYAVEQL
jgi:transposase